MPCHANPIDAKLLPPVPELDFVARLSGVIGLRAHGHGRGGAGAHRYGAPHSATQRQTTTMKCPFPRVEAFVLTLVCQGGVRGGIRRCDATLCGDDAHMQEAGGGDTETTTAHGDSSAVEKPQVISSLCFHISHNRWCHRIGRPHKSNHIMVVVDLLLGVAFQTCMDPDCRAVGFRSRPVSVPREVLASLPPHQRRRMAGQSSARSAGT